MVLSHNQIEVEIKAVEEDWNWSNILCNLKNKKETKLGPHNNKQVHKVTRFD